MNRRWLLIGLSLFLVVLVVSIWYLSFNNQSTSLPYPPLDNQAVTLSELLESEVETGSYNIAGYVTKVYYCDCSIGVLCNCPVDSISVSDNCVDEAQFRVDNPRKFERGRSYLFSIGVYEDQVIDTVANKVKSIPIGKHEVEITGYKKQEADSLERDSVFVSKQIRQSLIAPGDYVIRGYVTSTYDCGECPVGARFCSPCDRIVISDNCVDDLALVVDDSRPFEKGLRYDVSLKILPYEGKLSLDEIKVVGYKEVR